METTPISKTTTAIISITTLIAGFTGGQVLDNKTIDDLNASVTTITQENVALVQDKFDLIKEKQTAVDTYVYDMIRVGQEPSADVASTKDISQAYVNNLERLGLTPDINQPDVAKMIKSKAKELGETLICK